MSTHGFLILNFTFTFIIVYIMMNWESPDGKFALKSLHNKLENIRYYTEKKEWECFPVFYKNTKFSVRVDSPIPVEGLSYYRLYYIDTYINDELVCRLWSKERTFTKYRWVETTNKRHSTEIFTIIKQANKAYKKMYREDFNKEFSKTMDDKSYFKSKDINN
jgi:hypothetical protein